MGQGQAFGCGQCLPCRINKRRVWTHRILLEACQYEHNAFVTLTYDEESIPPNGTLVPKHAQDWLKRLRDRIHPQKVRYFIVGEYGDETQRPHYHAALFNFETCRYGSSQYSRSRRRCCDRCDLLRATWVSGSSFAGTLEPHSAAYVAGYVTKKMTRPDDERLDGRYPEFARMSLRPGIGADAMWEVASQTLQYLNDQPDVTTALRHGSKIMPLGRYLTRKLREYTGRDPGAPPETIEKQREKLSTLLDAASEITSAPGMAKFRKEVLKSFITQLNAQRNLQLDAREKLYKKRGNV